MSTYSVGGRTALDYNVGSGVIGDRDVNQPFAYMQSECRAQAHCPTAGTSFTASIWFKTDTIVNMQTQQHRWTPLLGVDRQGTQRQWWFYVEPGVTDSSG